MISKIAQSIRLANHPVALIWSDTAPQDALQFKPGRWGCVASLFAAVASKGKTAVFDRNTYGCWGGGVGLGFGNCYEAFPGGVEGFCGFLADGNGRSDSGRAIGEGLAQAGAKQLADDFLLGERYLKNADVTRRFLERLPMRDVPAKYVIVKPLSSVTDDDQIKNVTFFVEPDALSALVILANHTQPGYERVSIPYAAACQLLGILAYQESEREHPRALVGMTDISARKNTRASLGQNCMSFTIPWPMFLEMESNVEGSFFQRDTWQALLSDKQH